MSPVKHGTLIAYNQGCRCDECRSACALYRQEWHSAGGLVNVDRKALGDLLNEWFPFGLTSDSPAGRARLERRTRA